jgi:protein-S-isoprenylcysteine O-methyltransferase Ste14
MNLIHHPWNIVFLTGFVVYIGIRHVYERRARGSEKIIRHLDALELGLMGMVGLGSLLIPVLYLFTPLFAFADYVPVSVAPWFGCGFMSVALWLFWRSHEDLGANFSMSLEIRKEHQLIRRGVYRSIRHPMYASIWLFGIAQALLLPNWVAGFSALVSFTPLYFLRTPREEKMLREAFGETYSAYVRQTGRVFPHLK